MKKNVNIFSLSSISLFLVGVVVLRRILEEMMGKKNFSSCAFSFIHSFHSDKSWWEMERRKAQANKKIMKYTSDWLVVVVFRIVVYIVAHISGVVLYYLMITK